MDGGNALGRFARGPYGSLGTFWGRLRRSLGSQQADGIKPKIPPNEVGSRLEEEKEEASFWQDLLPNYANYAVGRAVEATPDTYGSATT